jgi:hypothetical protein
MEACSGLSTVQLIAAAVLFLGAVVSLDMFWVKTADALHGPDIARALRKRSWLNALVAAGAAIAVALLLFGVSTCSHGGF